MAESWCRVKDSVAQGFQDGKRPRSVELMKDSRWAPQNNEELRVCLRQRKYIQIYIFKRSFWKQNRK